jgi:hypothetical protein
MKLLAFYAICSYIDYGMFGLAIKLMSFIHSTLKDQIPQEPTKKDVILIDSIRLATVAEYIQS